MKSCGKDKPKLEHAITSANNTTLYSLGFYYIPIKAHIKEGIK